MVADGARRGAQSQRQTQQDFREAGILIDICLDEPAKAKQNHHCDRGYAGNLFERHPLPERQRRRKGDQHGADDGLHA